MLGASKPEFAPLLPPGRHIVTMDRLTRQCVGRFGTSASRPRLMTALSVFVVGLEELVGTCDVWVDGSFMTEKQEPEDIDLSVMVEGAVFDQLAADLQNELLSLASDQPLRPDLHTFVVVTRPRDHPGHHLAEDLRAYFAQLWSVTRVGSLKGIAVLRLGETDVGLRLFP